MAFFDRITKSMFGPVLEDLARQIAADMQKGIKTAEVPMGSMIGYPFSGNQRRKQGTGIDFETLRTFSVIYDVARVCINHRKRQIANLDWRILPKDPKASPDKFKNNIAYLTTFFEAPGHGTDFTGFLDKIIEDLLVFDAVVLWKDRTYGGELTELLNVDASTIRIKIAPDGTLPEPPQAAFQQIIDGKVQGEYSTDEMYYKIMNPRTNTPYGLGPLESLILGVDTALRSQMFNNATLSEGTIPEGFLSLPESWTPEQIKEYQLWFDSMLAGNTALNTRIKMIPGGKGVGYTPTKKPEEMRFIELEKWLLIKTCMIFDVQPADIGFIEHVNYSTSQTQEDSANQRGLVPMARFLKQFFTAIIVQDFGIPDLKFEWEGLQVVDDDFELKRNETMLRNGALTIDEWRNDQGLDPFNLPATQNPIMISAAGATLVADIGKEPEPQEEPPAPSEEEDDTKAQLQEMMKWETKVLNYLKKGKPVPLFVPRHLDRAAVTLINARLTTVKTREDVKAIFRPFRQVVEEQRVVEQALKLQRDIRTLKTQTYEPVGSR